MTFCSTLAVSLTLVVVLLPEASLGIKCYQCQSKQDEVCGGNLPKSPESTHPGFKYLVDCNTANKDHVGEGHRQDSFTFCRKQVQEVEGVKNIVRGCGLVKGDKACYSTGSPPTKTEVCQCFDDGCNGSLSLISSLSLLALSFSLIVFSNRVFTSA